MLTEASSWYSDKYRNFYDSIKVGFAKMCKLMWLLWNHCCAVAYDLALAKWLVVPPLQPTS